MSLFGKVRRTFSGQQSQQSLNSTIPNSPNHTAVSESIYTKGKSDRNNSLARPKGRKSFFRKDSANVKSFISEVAPALSLSFDEKGAPPSENDVAPYSPSKRKPVQPSPAAAIALAAASKPFYASPEAQVKYHQFVRLNVNQANELLQLCSQEIKMRGLATMGIFRPFRAAESVQQQEQLIELFLLYIDPKQFDGVFPISQISNSTLMIDTLGKLDAGGELKKKLSYANIYDIVAVFKWTLRRIKLTTDDLDSSWYETFAKEERLADYPIKAYTEIFKPSLSEDTRAFFDVILDLMSTVSAHHVANAMSASKLCKILGFWVIGRLGVDHPPHDLQGVIQSWEESAKIMEHLLLVYIRDQSSKNHLMPSRLMEIVKDYPYFGTSTEEKTPCLKPGLASMPIKALVVEIRSDNVVVSSKRPRGPRETLRAALKAQGAEADWSEALDDWSAILGVACLAAPTASVRDSFPKKEQQHAGIKVVSAEPKVEEEEIDARKESALFSEEHARIFSLVSAELERRKIKSESKMTNTLPDSTSQSTFLSDMSAIETDGEYRMSTYGSDFWNRDSARQKRSSTRPSNDQKVDWNTFTSDGFDLTNDQDQMLNFKLNDAYKPSPAIEDDRKSQIKRQSSLANIRRKRHFSSLNGSNVNEVPAMPVLNLQSPTSALQKATSMNLDECFVHFWQDQLLDDCVAARLPYLVFAQLNQVTASRLVDGGSFGARWLLVTESVIPPRPLLPQSSSSRGGNGRTLSILRRRNFSTASDLTVGDDAKSERRSLAPSLRSNWSVGVAKTKNGLKRMGSMISNRKSYISTPREDQQFASLQQSKYANRDRSDTLDSTAVEFLQGSTDEKML